MISCKARLDSQHGELIHDAARYGIAGHPQHALPPRRYACDGLQSCANPSGDGGGLRSPTPCICATLHPVLRPHPSIAPGTQQPPVPC